MKISLNRKPPEKPKTERKLDSWLMAYAEYTEENEAPEVFHLGVALTTLAGAVRRNVMVVHPFYTVHTNMYVVLVGPPGRTRKSTALRIGQNLLRQVPMAKFTTSATSPEALIKQLAALHAQPHQSLTAFSLEFSSFLGRDPHGMVDFLTDIWDCNPDWEKQTIARDLEKIPKPWFSLAAGTTRQWMGENLSSTAVEGGFVSRSLFLYANEPKCLNALPEMTPRMKELKGLLINDLIHISHLEGEFKFAPAAEAWYKMWYENPKRFPPHMDPRTEGYYSRKHTHLVKIAMLISLSRKDELVLELDDLQEALTLLEGLEPGMDKAFVTVGKNIYNTDIERIAGQIASTAQSGISIKELLRSNIHAMDKKLLIEILDNLVAMGLVLKKQDRYYSAIT